MPQLSVHRVEQLIQDAVRDRIALFRRYQLQDEEELGSGQPWKTDADALQKWLDSVTKR